MIILLGILYWISLYNYLLFHSLAEIFSILIAAVIFIIAWNARKFITNNFLIFLGVAYLFVALLDLLHTLGFKGMEIFLDYDYYANQLWIAARYLESISFLAAFLYLKRKKIHENLIFSIYSLITILLILSIFYWKIFPVCFVEGKGQTGFKIYSEYIIIILLTINIVLLYRNKKHFDERVVKLLIISTSFTIFSELFFTFYIYNYSILNLLGHYFKIISFYLIYKAIVETGFNNPIDLLFRELKQREKELEEINLTKDKFFSIIAHDLRSPFNTLIGFSELLLENFSSFSEEEKEKILKTIHSNSKKANHLLENLLNWSRSQTGNLKPRPSDITIKLLLEEIISLYEGIAAQKNIRIELKSVDQDLKIFADPDMIQTVLRNLLNNAVKFTRNNGTVILGVKTELNNAEIFVTDQGIGIPEEVQPNIFSITYDKSRKGTNAEKGSGLGLMICKEFVQKNLGTIDFKSREGEGTTFSVKLPLSNKMTGQLK